MRSATSRPTARPTAGSAVGPRIEGARVAPVRLTYLLPIKSRVAPDAELTEYLRGVAARMPVVIVDGSADDVFARNHDAWRDIAIHVSPDPDLACANGKVHGVLTGLRLVTTAGVVIADDDVRYGADDLDAVASALTTAELVCPQNYFGPLPWHARWDTARTLLNRATGHDFPGTLGVRTEVLVATGGYDGDVLFENLELMRTVRAAGGRCASPLDLYVRRVPPTTRHFLGQRVRQAYDDLARPWRFALSLGIVPALVAGLARRRRAPFVVLAAASCIVAAEHGRRRAGGDRVFPATSALLAPIWVLERGLCSWVALARRLTGGIGYADRRLVVAANPVATIRLRMETGRRGGPRPEHPEPTRSVGVGS